MGEGSESSNDDFKLKNFALADYIIDTNRNYSNAD